MAAIKSITPVMRHTPKNMYNDENGDVLSVFIVGDIGQWSTFGWNDLYRELQGRDLNTINVYLSTDGGSLIEAYKIYDSLVGHKAQVNMHLFGIVASAGTIIASAGDKVIMSKQSLYMIHRAYYEYVSGDANRLRQQADILESQESRAIQIYSERTGLDESVLIDMMNEESWIEPGDALTLGFVDEVVDALEIDFETTYKASDKYYDPWWDDYWFALKDDKSGQSAYQTAALNFIQKGLKPHKITNMAKPNNNLIDSFFNLLVGKNLISADKKDEFSSALNSNADTVTGIQKEVLNKAVQDAVKEIKPAKNEITFDDLKAVIDGATDDEKAELQSLLATDDAGDGDAAGEGGDATNKGGDAGAGASDEGGDAAGDAANADVQNSIKNLESEIARLKSTTGAKGGSNGGVSTANNAAKTKNKAANADHIRLAKNMYSEGALSPEQYKKITGEDAPIR